MADREKVIKGLECCSVMGDQEPSWNNITARNCSKCPYNKPGVACTRALAYAALELLKAQEPRLLTESEIMDAKNIDVYLEEATDAQTHPLRLVKTETESRNKAAFFWPSIVRPLNTYGVCWRCWTAEPTVDQRVLVQWE